MTLSGPVNLSANNVLNRLVINTISTGLHENVVNIAEKLDTLGNLLLSPSS